MRRNEDETVEFICLVDPQPDDTDANKIEWRYSKDGGSYSDLPDGAVVENQVIKITKVVKAHRGHYQCSLNDVSFSVLLRVKGF